MRNKSKRGGIYTSDLENRADVCHAKLKTSNIEDSLE